MDVNNTRFHLLLGRRDWLQHIPADAPLEGTPVWDTERHALTLASLALQLPVPEPGERFTRDDRRGAGRDCFGNWYVIDEAGTGITFLPAGKRVAERFWPRPDLDTPPPPKSDGGFAPIVAPTPDAPLALRGLAVTAHHYLVVGVLSAPRGLLVFDLHAGGPPRRLVWPRPFRSIDLAPRPDGGVWILDVTRDRGPRVWPIDRLFRPEPCDAGEEIEPGAVDIFKPEGEAPREHLPLRFPTGLPVSANPIAVEALPDGTFLILDVDGDATTVRRYGLGGPLGDAVDITALLEPRLVAEDGTVVAFRGYDFAFVPDEVQRPPFVTGTLFVAGTGGQQAFPFRVEADDDALGLTLRAAHVPLRGFTGKALVSSSGAAYFDVGDRWLQLAELPQRRYATEAVFTLDPALAFDGKKPGCVWHRLFLDACLPPGTSVTVETRAADVLTRLDGEAWETQPALYLRAMGAEIPHYRPFSDDELRREGTGTWELLFQRARGRYLQLRLTLRGNGRRAPRLHALRAYYDRFSYLDAYLPAVYREDDDSAHFLDRFLANPEGTFTAVEGRIAEAQLLFDTRTASDASLDWLAGWLGAVLDPAYDAARRRLFIDHAIELFNQRGTPQGIARAIRLVTDGCPDDSLFDEGAVSCDIGGVAGCSEGTRVLRQEARLIEHFLLRRVPGVVYGDPTAAVGPVVVTEGEAWSPRQGAGPLHACYRDFLRDRYPTIGALNAAWGESYPAFGAVLLSPVLPAQPTKRADWQAFIRTGLGFPYAEIDPALEGRHPTDTALWRDFLARRYGSVGALNTAHARTYASFAAVTLPAEDAFPASGTPLDDWTLFATLLAPMQRNAHRFTVLVPTRPGSDLAEQNALMDLVARVVEAEKPAHTAFEVKPFWALFRVGTARLGLDTLLAEGSRYVAVLLGRTPLAEGFLSAAHPWDVADRLIAGRDRVGEHPAL